MLLYPTLTNLNHISIFSVIKSWVDTDIPGPKSTSYCEALCIVGYVWIYKATLL